MDDTANYTKYTVLQKRSIMPENWQTTLSVYRKDIERLEKAKNVQQSGTIGLDK